MNAKFHALANRLSQLRVAIGDKQGRNGLADYLAFIPAGRRGATVILGFAECLVQ